LYPVRTPFSITKSGLIVGASVVGTSVVGACVVVSVVDDSSVVDVSSVPVSLVPLSSVPVSSVCFVVSVFSFVVSCSLSAMLTSAAMTLSCL